MKSKRGFSLTELVVVLGVFAVLLAILVPALMFWQRSRELTDAASALRSAIDLVRMQSIAQGNVYGVGLRIAASPGDADRYQITGLYTLDDPNDNMATQGQKFPSSVRYQLPLPGAGVAATASDTGFTNTNDGLVAFRTSGELESRYLSVTDTDPKIILTGRGSKIKTLTINRITGKVTVT